MPNPLNKILPHAELQRLANPAKAKILQKFFKTGPGQYAEGDVFWGITVPEIRKIAKKYSSLSSSQVLSLIKSPVHEERLLALLIWVQQFKAAPREGQRTIYNLYCHNTRYINNWDLVDLSADKIVGVYFLTRDRQPLYALALSANFWERRIAMIATFHFIKNGEYADTLKLASLLVSDKEPLIHKAVGWMLREVGKKNLEAEEEFLNRHYRKMPRTMLRYAIERFPEDRRKAYLKGKILNNLPI